eukprot:5601081-Karenia_brevis.AAC.1
MCHYGACPCKGGDVIIPSATIKAIPTSKQCEEIPGKCLPLPEEATRLDKENQSAGQLKILQIVYPAGINGVGHGEKEEWEELDIAVDSGATETVVPEDRLEGVKTEEGEAYKKRVRYEVADGTLIPNLGEK